MRSELIQPIVLLVDKQNPAAEVDGIRAVAVASVMAYILETPTGRPIWEEWLSGPFAKVVRRADRAQFDKLVNEQALDFAHTTIGSAEAIAFRPSPGDQISKAIARLQVAGTNLPAGPAAREFATSCVTAVNADLGMSTGKAAAQAAHALFLWHIQNGFQPEVVDTEIRLLDGPEFNALLRSTGATAVIEDAGRTEIEPGSVTAFALEV